MVVVDDVVVDDVVVVDLVVEELLTVADEVVLLVAVEVDAEVAMSPWLWSGWRC